MERPTLLYSVPRTGLNFEHLFDTATVFMQKLTDARDAIMLYSTQHKTLEVERHTLTYARLLLTLYRNTPLYSTDRFAMNTDIGVFASLGYDNCVHASIHMELFTYTVSAACVCFNRGDYRGAHARLQAVSSVVDHFVPRIFTPPIRTVSNFAATLEQHPDVIAMASLARPREPLIAAPSVHQSLRHFVRGFALWDWYKRNNTSDAVTTVAATAYAGMCEFEAAYTLLPNVEEIVTVFAQARVVALTKVARVCRDQFVSVADVALMREAVRAAELVPIDKRDKTRQLTRHFLQEAERNNNIASSFQKVPDRITVTLGDGEAGVLTLNPDTHVLCGLPRVTAEMCWTDTVPV